MSGDPIRDERNRLVSQIMADVDSGRLNHEQRVAALTLALDLLDLDMTTVGRVRYSSSVGNEWARATFTPENVRLAFDVQALIDQLNASN
jgi:hypothetical protein